LPFFFVRLPGTGIRISAGESHSSREHEGIKKENEKSLLHKNISATIILSDLAVEEPTSLLWLSAQEE
jgi:hypothetical protein